MLYLPRNATSDSRCGPCVYRGAVAPRRCLKADDLPATLFSVRSLDNRCERSGKHRLSPVRFLLISVFFHLLHLKNIESTTHRVTISFQHREAIFDISAKRPASFFPLLQLLSFEPPDGCDSLLVASGDSE